MFLQSKFFRIVSIFTLIFTLSVFAFADVIRLKDGSVLKGRITNFQNNQFTIVIGEGTRQRTLVFFADEIDSVIFESQATPAAINTDTVATTPIIKQPNYSEKTDGDTTIITVGSAPKTTPLPTNTNDDDDDEITDDDVVDTGSSNTNTSNAKPIAISAKVLADNTSNGWTNAGWVVRKGQRIRIISNGRISLGNGRYSGPRGISTLPDDAKLIKDKPTGSLIAVIGDDNNDFIFVGDEIEFVAERDGALFLGINEGVLSDNSGAFDVTIEISTTIGD